MNSLASKSLILRRSLNSSKRYFSSQNKGGQKPQQRPQQQQQKPQPPQNRSTEPKSEPKTAQPAQPAQRAKPVDEEEMGKLIYLFDWH
jgi:hypothetical protein